MDFITRTDLEDKFGQAWATSEDFDLYADQVNAWLTGQGLEAVYKVAEHQTLVLKASYFLARAAKEDALYISSDNVKARKGSAQPGTFAELTYFATAPIKNKWIKVAEDMLLPLFNLVRSQVVFAIDKII